jgi:uncharacterized protein YkwD
MVKHFVQETHNELDRRTTAIANKRRKTTLKIGVDKHTNSDNSGIMSYRRTKKRFGKFRLFVVAGAALALQTAPQPTMAASEPEWLTVVNLYRASAGLGPVTENPAASQGSIAHSQYLLKNRVISHGEDVGAPGYSAEGVRGGETGNVATGSGEKVGERSTIEGWMTAPFHGLAMIEPYPQPHGYGLVVSGSRWASTLSHSWDSYRTPGADSSLDPLRLAVGAVERAFPEMRNSGFEAALRGVTIVVTYPKRRFSVVGDTVRELLGGEPPFPTVVWPGNQSAVPLVRYAGSEWPDPITACKGWTSKAGLPLLIHRSMPTSVAEATVTDSDGTPLQLCLVDSGTYKHPDPEQEEYAKGLLETDAILIPKNPLTPGHTYKVHAELADGEVLDWTFGTTTDGSIKLPPGTAMEGRAIPGVPFQPVEPQPTKSVAKKPSKSPAKATPIKRPAKKR